ncbi:MAG: ATP-binding protein [Prevotella sp.]|jgi:predicted AAA+ superfamily ATPase|nr:ATP-binding protein [Prevotella sp.]
MDKLFERHDAYLDEVSMTYIRDIINDIDWNLRLIVIKGPKGVGKSTLMQQYIKKNYDKNDRHVLYCSADTSYFTTHSLIEVAEQFVKIGGRHLFIDEIHKYKGWSTEIKEIYDLYKGLRIVVSGSSLIQLNDGQADLSRRAIEYKMHGLSYREFLKMDSGIALEPVSLDSLLGNANEYCSYVREKCHPLEHFNDYLQRGYYPFFLEGKGVYYNRLEGVINYTIDVELTKHRNLEVGNTRSVKALLQVISQMTPYEVDIAKLSRATAISRPSTLKYLRNLEEGCLVKRLFADLNTISDLQKPDKLYLDNTNLLYALSKDKPEIGTVRETFFANQLTSAGSRLEYAGYKSGDFRIDGNIIVEVGGADKGFSQIAGHENAYVAADEIGSAILNKIPLWAFGFLY